MYQHERGRLEAIGSMQHGNSRRHPPSMVTTLGLGLFIILDSSSSLVSICAIEAIAASGVGMIPQASLIAYQSIVLPSDVAMATALFGFVRSLSTSISVVVGGVVFQNSVAW